MSNLIYVYLKTDPVVPPSLMDKLFKKLLKGANYEVDYDVDVIMLSFDSGLRGLVDFSSSLKAISEDLNIQIKCLHVPFFNSHFASLINYCKPNKLIHLFELDKTVKNFYKDMLDILSPFDEYTLKTVKAYIEMGRSPSMSSYQLFVHRNTVTYRIDRFSSTLNVDLSIFVNCVFIYNLIVEYFN